MSLESILEKLNAQTENISPIGATVKFVLDEHTIFIDGTGDKNVVSSDDGEADCVITTTLETFQKLNLSIQRCSQTNSKSSLRPSQYKP